jgi:hypothetical protein
MILTVTAGLNGGLNVTDALHSNSVLVISIDVLVFELTNLVQQNAEFVGNVGNVLISSLAPNGQLLLDKSVMSFDASIIPWTYSNFHSFTGNGLQASHHVLFHLDQRGELLGQVGAKGTACIATKGMAYVDVLLALRNPVWCEDQRTEAALEEATGLCG